MARLLSRVALLGTVLALAACGSTVGYQTAQRVSGTARTTVTSTTPTTTAATAATTSTTSVNPARALHKVLLLGDSEMFDAAPYATAAFKAAGIDVNSQAFPGTSLLGGTSVTKTFPTVVSQVDPDAVVMLYTGVYFPPYPKAADGRDITLAAPEFWQAWSEAAIKATRDLSANGARVYLVLLPHNDITWREHDTRMNGAYLAVRPAVPTVGYIDWRHTIISGRNGAPIVDAPIGPGGALEPVRGADGRHFSADASHVLADVMAQTVLEDYGINAAS